MCNAPIATMAIKGLSWGRDEGGRWWSGCCLKSNFSRNGCGFIVVRAISGALLGSGPGLGACRPVTIPSHLPEHYQCSLLKGHLRFLEIKINRTRFFAIK